MFNTVELLQQRLHQTEFLPQAPKSFSPLACSNYKNLEKDGGEKKNKIKFLSLHSRIPDSSHLAGLSVCEYSLGTHCLLTVAVVQLYRVVGWSLAEENEKQRKPNTRTFLKT